MGGLIFLGNTNYTEPEDGLKFSDGILKFLDD